MPAYTAAYLDGKSFDITTERGNVVMLNLWATWCGPCRSEMPALVKMQDAHRDKGFEVLGLNTDDETVEDINRFAGEMKLNYTLVWADTAVQAALLNISKFNGIPQSFIVDREGNLRGVFKGANPADVKKMQELVEMIVNE
jgi:thiol-disulfide isomerase/thioredoxin